MSSEDRIARAQDYVLGLMDDTERRRAERDLEVDPEFRDCVLSLAERLRAMNREKTPTVHDAAWAEISQRLASLPQMARGGDASTGPAQSRRAIGLPPKPVGRGAHETGSRRGTAIAIGLATAFALGYFAGRLALF